MRFLTLSTTALIFLKAGIPLVQAEIGYPDVPDFEYVNYAAPQGEVIYDYYEPPTDNYYSQP